MNAIRRSIFKFCRALNASDKNSVIENQTKKLLDKSDMMTKDAAEKFSEHHEKAVELVGFLKSELANVDEILRQKLVSQETEKLKSENERLKEELRNWQNKVIELETRRGIKQVPLPESSLAASVEVGPGSSTPSASSEDHEAKELAMKKSKKSPASKKSEKPAKGEAAPKEGTKEVHVGRLDLRIGRIVSVEKHPDADTLYVEKIDVGEEQPRTVVSGLVKFVPIEEMQNRLVMVLCNLKPVKMRGIVSEAMVMCASTPEKVEVLDPPEDAVPGDRVICSGFTYYPDDVLNPKKKIFEQVAPDLKTDENGVATYKSVPLKVFSKGEVKAASLVGAPIK